MSPSHFTCDKQSGVLADGITRKQVILPHPERIGTNWKGEKAYTLPRLSSISLSIKMIDKFF
jgi:hypothetical protein